MTIPLTKISATILNFGEPLLSQLDETPPIEVMRHTLQIIITVWNAHVLAMPEWGQAGHLESLNKLVDSPTTPPELVALIDVLTKRRNERFKNDPRAVGEWAIEPTDDGFRLRCDARGSGPDTVHGDPDDELPSEWRGR